jgi:hypothetical protein
MSEWLQWTLKDSFRVHIPPDAQTRLDDDGTTAVIRLGIGEDVSEVLMSNFPLKQPAPDRTALARELQNLGRGFFTGPVSNAVGHPVLFHVDFTEEPEGDLSYAQVVSVLEKGGDRIWVARFYGRPGMDRFWIMHWNGPKTTLETVLRIFVSFQPDEFSFR